MKIMVMCARCGETHEIEIVPFAKNAIVADGKTLTHWGMCLNLNEPVLMRIETKERGADWGHWGNTARSKD